jgi:murein DD-endopeptidase MepM/ murein hydrolase activator NlpD
VYIHRKEPKRRAPVVIAAVAFVATLIVVFGYAVFREPDRIVAALALPDLVTRTPTLIGEIEPTMTRPPTATRRPTNTRTLTPTPTPMATVAPSSTPRPIVVHFLVGRPVPPDAASVRPDRYYLYGATGRGEYEVHHGQEFVNPLGTTVVAAANGTIVVAGSDDLPQCGAGGNEICGRKPDYYGNVIILKLDEQYQGQPVYAVYGHVREVFVRPGQHVSEGEPLGEVGQEGIAIGPHVHFEVRLGANSYASTRNPILWMRPLPGTGSIAGRLQDRHGTLVRAASILVYAVDEFGTYIGDTETYARDAFPPVNSDDVLGENWAFPDLPEGEYIIRAYVGGLVYSRRVFVEAGTLTFIEFGG